MESKNILENMKIPIVIYNSPIKLWNLLKDVKNVFD